MASIQKRERNGKPTWRVQWRDPDGKLKSKIFDRESQAAVYRAKIEEDQRRARFDALIRKQAS